ncbi:MAG TPA: L,D-transpeptidase family protein [Thermoanaerobaculia bacterium]|nr:L,D-transpeptidase family protein [Thermoanaerobaculia bacterium]
MTAPRLYRLWIPTLLGVLALVASAPAEPASLGKADRILILKSERKLTLYREDKPLKTYLVALGGSPIGDKQCQGDQRTPGIYRIELKNQASRFHLSLRVSYPDATDKADARKRGCSPGGDIMIHGLGKSFAHLGKLHRATDWTLGCVAVTNEEIEEIWAAVDVGTAVEIRP